MQCELCSELTTREGKRGAGNLICFYALRFRYHVDQASCAGPIAADTLFDELTLVGIGERAELGRAPMRVVQSRRDFIAAVSAIRAAGLIDGRPTHADEAPPETSVIRLIKIPVSA